MFENGELKEGEKLPNQNELSAQLGVSIASLREDCGCSAFVRRKR